MTHFALIVLFEPGLQVFCHADIEPVWIRFTLQDVDVVKGHALGLPACVAEVSRRRRKTKLNVQPKRPDFTELRRGILHFGLGLQRRLELSAVA